MPRPACQLPLRPAAGLAFALALACASLHPLPAHAFQGFREATLTNGLRVVFIEHHANPMIASSVIVGAGVLHEPAAHTGASHLLEHLLFNGTTTRSQKQLYDETDRLGAYNNATTREDHTLFSLLIQKEFIEAGLHLQADMLFRSTLPPENFDKEKGIVLEEMARDAANPGNVAAEQFRAYAYQGTPLDRPVLGTRASITAMPREQVLAYYRHRYVPANMLLVLMGDFQTEQLLPVVERIFGTAPPASVPPAGPTLAWPPAPADNLATHPLDAPRFHLNAGFPLGLNAHDPLVPAVELLIEAAADGDDSPIQSKLVTTADSNAPALTAGLALALRDGHWSTVEFSATVPTNQPWLPVLNAFIHELQELSPNSPARARVELVRTQARAREILAADQIHYYALTRSDALLSAPPGWLDRASRRYDRVTDDQLNQAAALLAQQLAAVRASVSGPGLPRQTTRWPLPPPPTPTPAPTTSPRTRIDDSLPNGLRTLLEQNGDSQVFALHLLLRDRAASEPPGKEGIASFLHRLMARGSANTDPATLATRLARLGATLKTDDDPRVPFDDYYTTPEFSFVRLELPVDGWQEGLGLLREILTQPRLVPADIEAVRREMLDLQARRANSSRNRAVDAAEQALAPSHPFTRPVLGTPASIASITANDLQQFHHTYVTGRHLIVSVVSPVDTQQLRAAIERQFGHLPAGTLPDPSPKPPLTPPDPPQQRAPALKDQITIVLASLFDTPETDRHALTLAGTLLSDQLAFDLREQRGLAYSIGASIAPWAGRTRLLVTMGTRRENLDQALEGLQRGLKEFHPGDDAAVQRAATALRGRMLMRRLTRINQACFLGLAALAGRPPGDDLESLNRLLQLDSRQVTEAARRHLDPARCLVVIH